MQRIMRPQEGKVGENFEDAQFFHIHTDPKKTFSKILNLTPLKVSSLISQKSFQLSEIHKKPTSLHFKIQNPTLTETHHNNSTQREGDPRLCDGGGVRRRATTQANGRSTADLSLKPSFSLFKLIQ